MQFQISRGARTKAFTHISGPTYQQGPRCSSVRAPQRKTGPTCPCPHGSPLHTLPRVRLHGLSASLPISLVLQSEPEPRGARREESREETRKGPPSRAPHRRRRDLGKPPLAPIDSRLGLSDLVYHPLVLDGIPPLIRSGRPFASIGRFVWCFLPRSVRLDLCNFWRLIRCIFFLEDLVRGIWHV